MHPKSTEDLNLSVSELADVGTAVRWFSANTILCLKAIIERLADNLGTSDSDALIIEMEKSYSQYAD